MPLEGKLIPVVLGYANPNDYRHNPAYLGAIVGRVANRISRSRFMLGDTTYKLQANEGPHTLHGGPNGISSRIWNMEGDLSSVELCLTSPDGDQGFPGKVEFCVRISLSAHTLTYDMTAIVDRPTPINLAQHNYYNLLGNGDVRSHALKIAAQQYTPSDDEMIPTGEINDVDGTRFDFRELRTLSDADADGSGHDVNYVLNGEPAAQLRAPNGLGLELHTDQPGLQFYSASQLEQSHPPLRNQMHGPFSGLCLEPQKLPNAINTPGFGDTIVTPDTPYRQVLSVHVSRGTSP